MRTCETCKQKLKVKLEHGHEVQEGYYCCDEYYCSRDCLDFSFKGTGETWEQHYSDEGECYWTEWELNDNQGEN